LVVLGVPLTADALPLTLGVKGLVKAERQLLLDTAVSSEYLAEEVNVDFMRKFDPELCVGDI
jgi:hypothetical protein